MDADTRTLSETVEARLNDAWTHPFSIRSWVRYTKPDINRGEVNVLGDGGIGYPSNG